jgi:hypothetical protein
LKITEKIDSRTAKAVTILRATLCSAELETQLMEAVDNVGDFLRFVKISTRVDAKIRGCFEMEFKAMSPLPEMTE